MVVRRWDGTMSAGGVRPGVALPSSRSDARPGALPVLSCPPQVMIALLNTLGNVTQLDTQHYLLPKGLSSPLERKTTPLGAAMAVGVVGAALAALLAGGCALSVWHRRRKRRELAAVLDVRRGAMNANPELLLAAPPPSGSFKQPAVMELQPSCEPPPLAPALAWVAADSNGPPLLVAGPAAVDSLMRNSTTNFYNTTKFIPNYIRNGF